MARIFRLDASLKNDPLESEISNQGMLQIKSSRRTIERSLTLDRICALCFSRDASRTRANLSDARKVRRILLSFIDQVYADVRTPNHDHGLFHLRTCLPTDAFDGGRWHVDGTYFENPSGRTVLKYGMTLVGPPTLLKISEKNGGGGGRVRAVQPGNDEGYRWVVGETLHSEPPTHSSRIFCALLPCSKRECAQIWPEEKRIEFNV